MKSVRFIHTSDIHLDTGFSGTGFPSRLGNRKREAIRETFRRILEDARAERVDFVLVAGDLFELGRVTPDTVEFLKQQFASISPARVFVTPGNHDPFIKGSPYREESWPANVHVFSRAEFQSVELPEIGVRVTGFSFTQPFFSDHFFQKLPVLQNDFYNIVIAHASNIMSVPEGKAAHGPFKLGEIADRNIGYCALGHYHRQQRLQDPRTPLGDTEVWYAGIPEGRGWDEEGPRGYLFCEVDDSGVRVQSRNCSRFDLYTITIDCDGFSTREQILDAVLRHKDAEVKPDNIIRIRLEGTPDPRLDTSFAELEERLAGACLFIQWEDHLLPALDFAAVAGEKTLRGEFVHVLGERITALDPATDDEREALERARRYGVEALSGREVRLR